MVKTEKVSPFGPDSNLCQSSDKLFPSSRLADKKWGTRKEHFPLSHLTLTWHQILPHHLATTSHLAGGSDAHRMALQPIKGLGNPGCGSKDTEPHKTALRPRTPGWP